MFSNFFVIDTWCFCVLSVFLFIVGAILLLTSNELKQFLLGFILVGLTTIGLILVIKLNAYYDREILPKERMDRLETQYDTNNVDITTSDINE